MQRQRDGQEPRERRRVRQSNLQLYSDLSLSVLASKTSKTCLSSPGGTIQSKSKDAAVVSDLLNRESGEEKKDEGVTIKPQTRRSATSEDEEEFQSQDCSSGQESLLSTGCRGKRRENGRRKRHTSRENSLEIQICSELISIRNKMKREMEVVAEEEERLTDMARDLDKREEQLTQRLSEIEERAVEIVQKEEEIKIWKGDIKAKGEAIKQRGEQISQFELEIKGQEEKIGEREVEVKKKEVEMLSKEQELKTIEKAIKERELLVTQTEKETESIRTTVKQEEESHQKKKELLKRRENKLKERELKLYSQEKWLSEREEGVKEMEELACEAHRTLMDCIEREVEGRLVEVEGGWRGEVEKLERVVKEKNKEVKRLRECYNSTKKTNEKLIKELKEAEEKNCKLQSQLASSQSRLTALQKKEATAGSQELKTQKLLLTEIEALKQQLSNNSQLINAKRKKDSNSALGLAEVYEVLGSVMRWLCRVHLSQSLTPTQLASVRETSSKILPSLVPLIPSLTTHSQLPVLEFIHWCVLHLSTDRKSKFSLSSSLRRIGDIVSKPLVAELKGERIEACFTSSDNLHIRILSCLVIFQTVTQVDYLAHLFQRVHHDLKENQKARELFLLYCGVDCILSYMKSSCKLLCSHTVHTYLLLSSETGLLSQFLGTRSWFQACSILLREGCDTENMEKLIAILQTLSQIKGMRGLFESEKICATVSNLLRENKISSNPLQTTFIKLM